MIGYKPVFRGGSLIYDPRLTTRYRVGEPSYPKLPTSLLYVCRDVLELKISHPYCTILKVSYDPYPLNCCWIMDYNLIYPYWTQDHSYIYPLHYPKTWHWTRVINVISELNHP